MTVIAAAATPSQVLDGEWRAWLQAPASGSYTLLRAESIMYILPSTTAEVYSHEPFGIGVAVVHIAVVGS